MDKISIMDPAKRYGNPPRLSLPKMERSGFDPSQVHRVYLPLNDLPLSHHKNVFKSGGDRW
uniref:Uncharacterized protein n=1 Tax=Timema poppense TaxID=170557 RepID=A0A7R9CY60_TIMPO|nr:unnamed protein product [Timema poppensis]